MISKYSYTICFHFIILICSNVCSAKPNSIYDEQIYKQTVDYNAQVIDPRQTLELLEQLKTLIPEDEIKMKEDLNKLLDISVYDVNDCDSSYLYIKDYVDLDVNSLSSISKDEHYGPNIMAYIEFCGANKIENCSKVLDRSISRIEPLDLETVRSFTNAIGFFENTSDYLDHGDSKFVNGVLNYLKLYTKDFEKKISKTNGKFEMSINMNSVRNSCRNVLELAQPINFVYSAITDNLFSPYIFNNNHLKEWASIRRYCQLLTNKFEDSEIFANYHNKAMKDKMRNFF